MTVKELKELHQSLEREVAARRALGGYSVEAGAILALAVTMHKIVGHLLKEERAKAKKSK